MSEIRSEERIAAQVTADSRRSRISVRYWPGEGEEAPGLAVFLADLPDVTPVAAEFRPVEGEAFVLAEIEHVPQGAGLLLIGPPAQHEGGESWQP